MKFLACMLLIAFWSDARASSETYRQLRYSQIISQTTWYTCGPAALATLFTFYYGQPVSEAQITKFSVEDMVARGKDPQEGVTVLTLRNTSRANGIEAAGYRLTFEQLQDTLKSGLPVLVNTLRPQPHFAVVVAIEGNTVILADPSWGLKTQDKQWFLDAWNGVTLIPTPNEGQAALARAQVQKIVTAHRERIDRLRSGL